MAIYHLNASIGSRKSGQSATAKHDYVLRSGKYVAGSREVLFSESGNLPDWAVGDPRVFWGAADLRERENACLFRQFEFSLPIELSEKNRIALVRKFIEELTVGREGERGRMPYSWAIHRGGPDGHNPHVHLILSERLLPSGASPEPEVFFRDPRGGGCRKSRRFSSGERKKELIRVRERWAELANAALSTAGVSERINHRSFEDRGINDLPDIHIGAKTSAQERKGIRTERGDRAVRRRRARRRLAGLEGERKRTDGELREEAGDASTRNNGSDRERQRQLRPGEPGNGNPIPDRPEPKGIGQGPSGTGRTPGSDSPVTKSDPLDGCLGAGGGAPLFDFSDLAARHGGRKIVRQVGKNDPAYWIGWRERILTEAYGQEIRRTGLSRWKVRKKTDSLEFCDWNDAGTKITDTGGRIEAETGNAKEAAAIVELARLKGWNRIVVTGNEEFFLSVSREARKNGIEIAPSDERQRMWLESLTNERREVPPSGDKSRKPKMTPG